VGARRDDTHSHPGAKSDDALRFSELSVTPRRAQEAEELSQPDQIT